MYVSFCFVLRAFEIVVLRNKLGLKGRNNLETGANGILKRFLDDILHQVLLNRLNQERVDGLGM